jgi:hypothetical protein
MVQIEFDRSRSLMFDLAAIRDLEQQMDGQPLGRIVNQLANLGVNALVLCLWAGLKHEDRTLTPAGVTKRLETYLKKGGKLRPLADGLNSALEECGLFSGNSDGDEGKDDEGNPSTERPGS